MFNGEIMGLQHLTSGQVINLQNVGGDLPENSTFALVKTPEMEVIRMVIPKGKKIPDHSVPGKISVQCISGQTRFFLGTQSRELKSGDWLFLEGGQSHALEAITDTALLVTILLN